MDDALLEQLKKKEEIINRILEISGAQNSAVKNRETGKIISLDNEKAPLVESLAEIDNSLKPFIFKNNRYPVSVRDMVKKINLSLNNLIDIERENHKLLAEMEMSASGRHIESYKRSIK
jgi:hypothetical protein